MIARIERIIPRQLIGILIPLVAFHLMFDRLVQFRMDDRDLLTWFHTQKIEPHIGYFKAKGRTIRYIKVGNRPEASILFIHGAPRSLSYWKGYLAVSPLLSRPTLYAVYRPGYAYSGLSDSWSDISRKAGTFQPPA